MATAHSIDILLVSKNQRSSIVVWNDVQRQGKRADTADEGAFRPQ